MAENNADSKMTFETALARLEEIVRLLESGDAPLDKSLELYQEGVELVRLCNERLDNAQRQIKILVNEDGKITEREYIRDDNK